MFCLCDLNTMVFCEGVSLACSCLIMIDRKTCGSNESVISITLALIIVLKNISNLIHSYNVIRLRYQIKSVITNTEQTRTEREMDRQTDRQTDGHYAKNSQNMF